MSAAAARSLENRNLKTGLMAFGAAVAMLGMGYAAVPLYELFCQVTGFGGTTQRATESEADLAARMGAAAGGQQMSVRFDGTVAPGLGWDFKPEQVTDTVTIGQRDMAIYIAKNNSNRPITGTATFNVEPQQAGIHFSKIQCFCFVEQTLQPGEEVRMPVLYFVDPAALDDPLMEGVEQITLSYTFHEAIAGS